ncbi:tetratricopeptide repeat protein [Streptomyces sp. NPDC088910]|uniref:tetratricopeptide repeat protein n=1 Tax=Streptomyces sp. NPDC088910 TaxID=3365911 RepID=UPI0037F32C4B
MSRDKGEYGALGGSGQRRIPPPRVAPGPLRDLKLLLYRLYLEAKTPPVARIADLIAADPDDLLPGSPSKDTVHRIIGSAEFPAQQANVVSVAGILAREARWDVVDAMERVRAAWVSALLAELPGKPLSELDPYALEVHQSITVAEDEQKPTLPAYVVREHDRRVHERVDRAISEESLVVTLVGESSTGKTRTFWEAIQQLPPKWRLWQGSDSAPHADLAAELEKIGPYTVVWLNEAQRFLLTADPAEGEQLAAALRRIMYTPERRPVLILVTLWPEYWDQLTSEPRDGQRDLHPNARHVLNGSSIRVPVTFEERDLDNLKEAAAHDARLAQAMERAEQRQVAQYLAGVPALIQRYQTAPRPVRALIDAAMDLRRIGFGENIPLELLEAAAYEYLTDLEFDYLPADWLEDALAYAAKPQRGVRGPLTRVRPRSRKAAEGAIRYRLADPLDQLGREERRRLLPPPGLWELLQSHSTPAEAMSIGRSAEGWGLYREAVAFYKKSSGSGSSEAALDIANILTLADRGKEAVEWYEEADHRGASNALRFAGETLANCEEVDWDSVKSYYLQAAQKGDIFALGDCRDHMKERGYDGDVEEWFHESITYIWEHVSVEQVMAWYEHFGGRHKYGRLLISVGETDRGFDVLERSVAEGNFMAMYAIIDEKRSCSGIDSVISYLKKLGHDDRMGRLFAPMALKNIMISERREEECVEILKEMVESGNNSAADDLAELMCRMGRSDEVIDFLYPHSESNAGLAYELAAILERESRVGEAVSLLFPLATVGDSRAQHQLAGVLEKAGRIDEALDWYQKSAEDGQSNAAFGAVRLLLRAQRGHEALAWLRMINDPDTSRDRIECGASVLESMGRHDEAERLKEYGWEPDGGVSAPWSIAPIGRQEGVISAR